MILLDIIDKLETLDDDLTIYQRDLSDINSELVLMKDSEFERISVNGVTYYYLLEVFLAKELVQDLVENEGDGLEPRDIAKRIQQYGINDA